MFKFYIGYTEIRDHPDGWEDMTATIRLDKELKGLFQLMDTSLTFHGDGHDLLKSRSDTYGYCHKEPFEVRQRRSDGNYYPVYSGLIFLKDVEFTEGRQGTYAKVSPQDNGFYARIFNNRNLKAKIYAGKSRNNVDITPAPYFRMKYFNPTTGTYYAMYTPTGSNERTTTCFKVFDVLRYLVDFMSDGTVNFSSTIFDTGGKYEDYYVTNGYCARFAVPGGTTQELFQDNWDEMSFSDILTELNVQFNLGFVVSFNGSTSTLQVEEYSYLFQTNIVDSLTNCEVLKRKPASEYLYGSVDTGSEIITDEAFLSFPARIRLVGFEKQTYIILGDCNNDRVLNLTNKWIIDTNTIEDLVVNYNTVSTANDKNFILINATPDTGNIVEAVQSNWLTGGATPQYYNEQLNSNNKLSRYLGAIPNSIAIALGATDNTFSASSPTQYTTTTQLLMDFTTEISDPNNNYDPVGKYYTVPTTGVYTFEYSGILNSLGIPCLPKFEFYVEVYDSGDTPGVSTPLISYNISPFIGATSSNCVNVPFTISGSVNATAAQKISFKLVINSRNIIRANSIITLVATADGGGTYKTFNPEDFPIMRSTISDYPFHHTRFNNLSSDPRGLFSFNANPDGQLYFGNIEEFRYKIYKQEIASAIFLSTERVNQ